MRRYKKITSDDVLKGMCYEPYLVVWRFNYRGAVEFTAFRSLREAQRDIRFNHKEEGWYKQTIFRLKVEKLPRRHQIKKGTS